jgi:hypothetical protein
MENTLLRLEVDAEFLAFLENLANMTFMFLESFGEDQEIVEVREKEYVKEFSEGIVDEMLEGTRSVA